MAEERDLAEDGYTLDPDYVQSWQEELWSDP